MRVLLAVSFVLTMTLAGLGCDMGSDHDRGSVQRVHVDEGFILRVYTDGGPGGSANVTEFPAATPERGYDVLYDPHSRTLAVGFLSTEPGPTKDKKRLNFFVEPLRWSITPD